MDKIMHAIRSVNIMYTFVFVTTITVVLSNLYWTKYRPMIATKDCAEVSTKRMEEIDIKFSGIDGYTKTYDFIFSRCMKIGYGIN